MEIIGNLIKSKIRDALSYYVVGGENRDINLGVTQIVLEHLTIKHDALTESMRFNLPIQLTKVTIGRITIHLPIFMLFSSRSVKVDIDDFFIEAQLSDSHNPSHLPPSEDMFKEYIVNALKAEVASIWQEIERVLQKRPAQGPLLGDDDESGILGRTIAKVKNNMQFTVNRFQLTIEDSLVVSFSLLDVFTTNEEYSTASFDADADRVVRKVLNFRDFEVKLNLIPILLKTNLDVLIKLDFNPLHVETHKFAREFRVLFLSSLNIYLNPEVVQLLQKFSQVVNGYQTTIDRMRFKLLRQLGKNTTLSVDELLSQYEPLCKARLEKPGKLAPATLEQSMLECQLPIHVLRANIIRIANESQQAFRQVPVFVDLSLTPFLSPFPFLDEFEVTLEPNMNIQIDFSANTGVLIGDSPFSKGILTSRQKLVGAQGFWFEDLCAEDKLKVFQSLPRPCSLRFRSLDSLPSSSQFLCVVLPNFNLQLAEDASFCAFGVHLQMESILSVQISKINVWGVEGTFASGGVGTLVSLSQKAETNLILSPTDRLALLTINLSNVNQYWGVIVNQPWRSMTKPPLVSNLLHSTLFDEMIVDGEIGSLVFNVNPSFCKLLGWQQAFVSPPSSSPPAPSLSLPPVVPIRTYCLNLKWESLNILHENFLLLGITEMLVSSSDGVKVGENRFHASFHLLGGSRDVFRVTVSRFDVVFISDKFTGVSLSILPKKLILSTETLRKYFQARNYIVSMLPPPNSVSTSSDASVVPTVSFEQVSVSQVCQNELEKILGFQLSQEDSFSLNCFEASDLYVRLFPLFPQGLKQDVGLQIHSLNDLVNVVMNPIQLQQPCFQVGMHMPNFKLVVFEQWEIKLKSLKLGAITNFRFLQDISCRVELHGMQVNSLLIQKFSRQLNPPPVVEPFRLLGLNRLFFSFESIPVLPSAVVLDHTQIESIQFGGINPSQNVPAFTSIGNQYFGEEEISPRQQNGGMMIHLRLESLEVRISYAVADSLLSFANEFSAIMAEFSPPVPPSLPPSSLPANSPVVVPTFFTFSLFGIHISFQDLTRSSPKRVVALSFLHDLVEMKNENFTSSLFFEQTERMQKSCIWLKQIKLKLIVIETPKQDRVRTILNPVGFSLSYLKVADSPPQLAHSTVQANFYKSLSFSFWAEELKTFQEILNCASTFSPAKNEKKALEPPLIQTEEEVKVPKLLEKRVTFDDSVRTSSDGLSFYTAKEMDSLEEEDDELVEESFTVQVNFPEGVDVEIVKRALGRISAGSFLPVVLFRVKPLSFVLRSQTFGVKDFVCSCFFAQETFIHNLTLGAWEPLVEKFQVEITARRIRANHLDFRFWISTRINVNLSEIDCRMLLKLLGDFSYSKKGKGSSGLKNDVMLTDIGPDDYGLANRTGIGLEVVHLYQVGCALPGTLRVEVRDAWSLPFRTRWQNTPTISAKVLPWKDTIVINHVPNFSGERWTERPLRFSFLYPGTSGDFPKLELSVVGDDPMLELTATVELAPHILVPSQDGVSEWISLYSKRVVASEMLIRIFYEYDDDSLHTPPQTQSVIPVANESVQPVSFANVPPNVWINDLSRSQFLKKGNQNTMRLAKLSFHFPEGPKEVNLEVDETNAYMLRVGGKVDVFVKSAQKSGGKRMIQLESPVLVVNETLDTIEVFVCRKVANFPKQAILDKVEQEPIEEEQLSLPLTWSFSSSSLQNSLLFQTNQGNFSPGAIRIILSQENSIEKQEEKEEVQNEHQRWSIKGLSIATGKWKMLCAREKLTAGLFNVPNLGPFTQFQFECSLLGENIPHDPTLENLGIFSLNMFPTNASPSSWICSVCEENNPGSNLQCSLCMQDASDRSESMSDINEDDFDSCTWLLNQQLVYARFKLMEDKEIHLVDASSKELAWFFIRQIDRMEIDQDRSTFEFILPKVRYTLKFSPVAFEHWRTRLDDLLNKESVSMKKIKRHFAPPSPSSSSELVKQTSVFSKVLLPGNGFAVPVEFFIPGSHTFQIFIRPANSSDSSCALLVDDLFKYRDALFPRTWLRCKSPPLQSLSYSRLYSAHVQSRFVPGKITENSGNGTSNGGVATTAAVGLGDTRPNRVKFRIVPWLLIQNALPYTVLVRFFDGLVARDEVHTFSPGQERGFLDVDEHAVMQVKLDGFQLNYAEWSNAILPYREDTAGFTMQDVFAADQLQPEQQTQRRRFPQKRQLISIPHAQEDGLPLNLVMERSTDTKTSLRCTLFSTCWVYNYSDVGVSIKMGRQLMSTATANTSSLSSGSFIFPAKRDDASVLPGLVTIENETTNTVLRICGIMFKWDEAKNESNPSIQQMMIVNTAPLREQKDPDVAFSKSKFSFKVATAVHSCDFFFPTKTMYRFLSIEVSRPDTVPFNRSFMIVVRSRFLLLNQLIGPTPQSILFRESSLFPKELDSKSLESTKQPLPYHFSKNTATHFFQFALSDSTMSTRFSGELELDPTKEEKSFCVTLRSFESDSPVQTRIRVSIKPNINGTVMVVFSSDVLNPLFKLDNRSTIYYLELKQTKTKMPCNLIVDPSSSSPFGFDEPMKPTLVSLRVLVELPDDRAPLQNASKICRNSSKKGGKSILYKGMNLVPASTWQSYATEAVSERDPLKFGSNSKLLVEGVVDGSSLVLRVSPLDNSQFNSSCVLAVKIISGINLHLCKPRFEPNLHPYVVVSVGGKTKQNSPKTTGDTSNPQWEGEEEVFELNEVPQFLSCNLCNNSQDVGNVLANARIPLPRSLFRRHLERMESKKRCSTMENGMETEFFDFEEEKVENEAEWIEVDSDLWKELVLQDDVLHKEELKKGNLYLRGLESVPYSNKPIVANSSPSGGFVPLHRLFHHENDSNSLLRPQLKIAVCIIQLPPKARSFVFGAETTMRLEMNSFALSFVNLSKKKEVAYFCLQRAKVAMVQTCGTLVLKASLGNMQLDSFVSNAHYPIALYHEQDGRDLLLLECFILQSHPSVRFFETLRISVEQINVDLEERLLSEIAGIFARGIVDLVNAPSGFQQQSSIVLDEASLKVPYLTLTSNLQSDKNTDLVQQQQQHLMYFDSFEIFPLRIKINLDLHGGREIEESEDEVKTAIRDLIPIITLEVRDLFLRISGIQRTGWFLPQVTWRETVSRHYLRQIVYNMGKVLTSTNFAGNPLQAGRTMAGGFYSFFAEPIKGVQDDDQYRVVGFCYGLSSGVTALFAGVATGLSETVHGLSGAVVNAYNQFAQTSQYDATTQPMASVMELLRDVSGALAASAREIKEEVIKLEKQEVKQIRLQRTFQEWEVIRAFGGGSLPRNEQKMIERQAAKRILRWFRRLREHHKVALLDLTQQSILKLNQEQVMEANRPKSNWQYCCGSIQVCFVQFQHELNEVKEAAKN